MNIVEILNQHSQWLDTYGRSGQQANLRGADLIGEDPRGAILDLSCLPLWCGSFDMCVDDRFISQLFYHLIKLDTSGCSEQVQTLMRELRSKEAATWFKKYRSDI